MGIQRLGHWILCFTTIALLVACQDSDGTRRLSFNKKAKQEKYDTLSRQEIIRQIIGDSTEVGEAFLQEVQDSVMTEGSMSVVPEGRCEKTVRLLSDKQKENALVMIENDCGQEGKSVTHYRLFDDEIVAIRHFESKKDTLGGGFNNLEVVLFNDDSWSGLDRESVSDKITNNLNKLKLREMDSTEVRKLVLDLEALLKKEVK